MLECGRRVPRCDDLEAAHYVEELRRRIVDLEQEKTRLEKERKEFDDWKQKELDQLKAQHKEEIAKVEKKLERIVQEMSDGPRELECGTRRFRQEVSEEARECKGPCGQRDQPREGKN